MDWKNLFTSFNGRIGRQQWWIGLIALVVAQWIVMMVIGLVFGSMTAEPAANGAVPEMPVTALILSILVAIPFVWAGLALSAKRWHDRGKSAWWILINIVPVIGGIWALVENGFLKGTDGPNQYGPDPVPN